MIASRNFLLVIGISLVNLYEYVRTDDKDGSSPTVKPNHFIPKYFWGEKDNIAEANILVGQEKFSKAIKFYNKAIAKNRFEARYYVLRGKCYLEMKSFGDEIRALYDFYEAYEKSGNPNEGIPKHVVEEDILARLAPKLYPLHCNSFMDDDQKKHLLWCFDELTKMNPSNVEYILMRAGCTARIGDFENAISDIKQANRMDPENKCKRLEYLKPGIVVSRQFAENIKELLSLLNAQEFLELGEEFRTRNRIVESLYCFKEALKKSTDPELLAAIAKARDSSNDEETDTLLSDLKKRVELYPHDIKNSWFPYTNRLLSEKKVDEFSEEAAILLSDEELVELANLFRSENNIEFAILIYSEAIRRNPSEGSYFKMRGNCYLQQNQLDLAVSDLKIWIQQNPDDENDRVTLKLLFLDEETKSLLNKAMSYLRTNQLNWVLIHLTAALDRNPNCELCHERKGLYFWKMRQYKSAITSLEKSIELAPWDLVPQIDLYKVLVESEQRERAAKLLEELEEKLDNIASIKGEDRVKSIREKLGIPSPVQVEEHERSN